VILARDCVDYTPTQFYPNAPRGAYRDGVRCEDLEQQTFDDESFDLVITQDVMEHIFHPDRAYREIWRTLKTRRPLPSYDAHLQGSSDHGATCFARKGRKGGPSG